MATLLDRFRAHLEATRPFPEPGVALVAVSGGADSVALLDLLHSVISAFGLSLVVAHADHGIQSDSGTVGQSVRALAQQYGLPFELGELRLGPDASETVARLGDALPATLGRLGRHAARDRRAWDQVLDLLPDLSLRVAAGGFDVARAALARYDDALAAALLGAAARRVGLVLAGPRARRL